MAPTKQDTSSKRSEHIPLSQAFVCPCLFPVKMLMVFINRQGAKSPRMVTQKRKQPPSSTPSRSRPTVIGYGSFGYYTANIGQGLANTMTSQPRYDTYQPICPYHYPIMQMHPPCQQSDRNMGPMERFLAETGPAEQSSLFMRPDTGLPSTSKDCTCSMATMDRNIEQKWRDQKLSSNDSKNISGVFPFFWAGWELFSSLRFIWEFEYWTTKHQKKTRIRRLSASFLLLITCDSI